MTLLPQMTKRKVALRFLPNNFIFSVDSKCYNQCGENTRYANCSRRLPILKREDAFQQFDPWEFPVTMNQCVRNHTLSNSFLSKFLWINGLMDRKPPTLSFPRLNICGCCKWICKCVASLRATHVLHVVLNVTTFFCAMFWKSRDSVQQI
jgi:hypothetical protein